MTPRFLGDPFDFSVPRARAASPRFLGDAAPSALVVTRDTRPIQRQDQPYGEEGIRFSLEQCAKRAADGRLDRHVRSWTMRRLYDAGNPKGPVARARALHGAVMGPLKNGRWAPDPTDAEFMPAARDMMETCKGDETNPDGSCPLGEIPPFFALGDCFAEGTLMLAEGHTLVPVESLLVGMRIWGLDRWSTVMAVASKGTLPIDVVRLHDGGAPRLTGDHHAYVLDCREHPMLGEGDEPKARPDDPNVRGCACGREARTEKRARVSELRSGMFMPAPEAVPLFVSRSARVPMTRASSMRRVVAIDRDVAEVPCWDITTDDHRVYLAEHDVTVSQCDDLSIQLGSSICTAMMLVAAAGDAGVYGAIVGHGYTRDKIIEHVLCAVWGEGKWWYCDPSMPSVPFGECKAYTRERAIYVPSLDLACDADVCLARKSVV